MTDSLNPQDIGFFVLEDLKKSIEYWTKIKTFRVWDFEDPSFSYGAEVILKMSPTGEFIQNEHYEPYQEAFGFVREDYLKDKTVEDWFELPRSQSFEMDLVLEVQTAQVAAYMERDFFNAARLMAKYLPPVVGSTLPIWPIQPSRSPFSEDITAPRTLPVNWENSTDPVIELVERNTQDVFSKIEEGLYSLKYSWRIRLYIRLDDPYKQGENPDPQE